MRKAYNIQQVRNRILKAKKQKNASMVEAARQNLSVPKNNLYVVRGDYSTRKEGLRSNDFKERFTAVRVILTGVSEDLVAKVVDERPVGGIVSSFKSKGEKFYLDQVLATTIPQTGEKYVPEPHLLTIDFV